MTSRVDSPVLRSILGKLFLAGFCILFIASMSYDLLDRPDRAARYMGETILVSNDANIDSEWRNATIKRDFVAQSVSSANAIFSSATKEFSDAGEAYSVAGETLRKAGTPARGVETAQQRAFREATRAFENAHRLYDARRAALHAFHASYEREIFIVDELRKRRDNARL